MKVRRLGVVPILVLAIWFPAMAGPGTVTLSEQASLQAAMQRHIDGAMVNGRYLHLDGRSGEIRPLRPLAAHPEILQMGEYFVLCTDFETEDGTEVNVDFFLARKGRSFVVFGEQVENRELVMRLMKSGKVERTL